MTSKDMGAGLPRPNSGADLLLEALQSQALFEIGALASHIAGLIAAFRRQLPECSVAILTVDGATHTVEGIKCSDDVVDEMLAPAISELEGIFKNGGLGAKPAPPPNPLQNMDPALWAYREISQRLLSVVMVWREKSFGPFAELDIAAVGDFVEAIAATLRLRISHDGQTVNRLCSLLDQCGMAFIMLDGAMNFQRANDRGGKMIDSRDYFTRAGDRLELSNAALGARFRSNIANLLARPAAGSDEAIILPLQNRNDASVIKATVLRLRTVQDQLAGRPVASLVIPFVQLDAAITSADLVGMGLTKAEADLAIALLDGMTVKEYAQIKGRAVPTVRAHLKRAMRRLEVHRQADLVRVLLGLKKVRTL